MSSLPQTASESRIGRTAGARAAVRGTATTTAGTDVDALVRECLPLVHHHVRAIAARIPSHVDRDELVSAGMFALATCAPKYDATVGTSFAQFASTRIRGALLDELRSMDWASRSVRRRARDVAQTVEELNQTLGRSATTKEIADAMGIDTAALGAIRADAQRGELVSLQTIATDDTSVLPIDLQGPDAALLAREQLGTLRHAMDALPERLRIVVEQYFFGQRKMSEIAADLGVTESRVSQLRSQALLRLRDLMRDDATDSAEAEVATPRAGVPARTLGTSALAVGACPTAPAAGRSARPRRLVAVAAR